MAKLTWKRRKLAQLGICPTPDELWKRVQNTDLRSLLSRDEAIAVALAIHNGDSLQRAELEARVLADQPKAEIAAKMALPEDVVIEYEDWFFDVRDKFAMTGWIAREAIRRRPTGELYAADIGSFWRWLGYIFGSVVLDRFLVAADAEVLRIQGIDAYWKKGSPLDPDLRLIVLAQRIPLAKTQEQLIRWSRLREEIVSVQDLRTDDLLTPLTLELYPFSETEFAVSSTESDPCGTVEATEGLMAIFDFEPCPVVQAQAA